MDFALVIAAAAVSLTYLIEIDSVCLIDLLNGERARIMAETLQAEIEFAETMGCQNQIQLRTPNVLALQASGWLPLWAAR